jgi:hypothetical protein
MSRWLPIAGLLVVVAAVLICILRLNGGIFTYSLDDPYIHLSLAENIARFHYGVNAEEFSSPSSSVVWPFLLAPFAAIGLDEYAPLLLNIVFAAASVALLRPMVAWVVPESVNRRELAMTALVLALTLGLNLVGLAFTGMEHSLQVLLALALGLGLVAEAEQGRVSPWLILAVVLGPMVRYENAALSAAAILYLALRGRVGLAAVLALAVAVPLAAFSYFLVSLGLDWLPGSVLVKSGLPVDPSQQLQSLAGRLVPHVPRSLAERYNFLVMVLLTAALVASRLRALATAAEKALAAVGVLVIFAHVVFGRFGYSRYEVYALAFLVVALAYCWRGWLGGFYRRWPVGAAFLPSLAVIVIFGVYLARMTILSPLAASNIYEQQYQMHRFLVDFYRQPVAVNDLGLTSWRNENEVLDLAGLGSLEALHLAARDAPGWQADLVRRRDISLVMIYRQWAAAWLPSEWLWLGRLHLGRARITPWQDTVDFYAAKPDAVSGLREKLAAFATTLPPGVTFEAAE